MSVTKLTTSQLLALTRGTPTPPPGFVAVQSDQLTPPALTGSTAQASRIAYTGFYNATTNELIISGTPKPFVQLAPGQDPGDARDLGIFADSSRVMSGSNAGGFVGTPVAVAQTISLALIATDSKQGQFPGATVTFVGEGAVGLAFSAASYNLRGDPTTQGR